VATGNDLALQCRCGAVRGVARGVTPRNSNHCVCYCDDCQAFSHFLGRADDVLDAFGGTRILHLSPARLSFTAGAEHIAVMRLSAKGMLRWHTSCCRTPIGNTLTTGTLPFIGLIDAFVREPTAALGPIRGRSFPEGAKGGRAAVSRDGLPVPLMVARVIALMLSWRLRGDHRHSPLFEVATGQPRVTARVLDTPEREELKKRCAAWHSWPAPRAG
jgi:hypothetical protein